MKSCVKCLRRHELDAQMDKKLENEEAGYMLGVSLGFVILMRKRNKPRVPSVGTFFAIFFVVKCTPAT